MRRSHLLISRTWSLEKTIYISRHALLSGARARVSTSSVVTKTRPTPERSTSRILASKTGPPGGNDGGPGDGPEVEGSSDSLEPETKYSKETATSDANPGLPDGLDILWTPSSGAEGGSSYGPSSAIPPPEILDLILTNLHISLHPLAQHKATYISKSGPLIEPTLALYCPIEGGDYIIDAAMRELGNRAGVDVVVIDAAHIAAGECGHFGNAASVFQLKDNPLHFSATAGRQEPRDNDDYDDDESDGTRVVVQVMGHPMSSRSIPSRNAPQRNSGYLIPQRAFFDKLINLSTAIDEGSERPPRRPRIIYIRDFPTLAPSSSTWYPALLAAVRERRQGALSRATSPILNPTTIVFGATPDVRNHPTDASTTHHHSHFHFSRPPSPSRSKSTEPTSENAEDDAADKGREKRLRDWLRKWEKGDSDLDRDIPRLQSSLDHADKTTLSGGSGGAMIIGENMDELPPGLLDMVSRLSGGAFAPKHGSSSSSRDSSEQHAPARFFRTSVVLPSMRSPSTEKDWRLRRRRELNELSLRMAVSSIGGTLERSHLSRDGESESTSERPWIAWGNTMQPWSKLKQIADMAVAQTINSSNGAAATLDATIVTWPTIFEAWNALEKSAEKRKSWIQHATEKAEEENDEEEEEGQEEDSIIEQIKQEAEDGELDSYVQKMMGSIVDAASITTTFDKVHLPEHTIDSVRTIVSLPLLHPDAFSHGILKEHSMTGCLLFGPPGTGKTLLVRALAKEAGCRMLTITPSDVMDMYVGETEKSVKAIFTLARRLSPCVVFIDEIDALFGARSSGEHTGGDHAHRGVITEFMQEMDGLKSKKEDNIMVIGATNRPFDLDDAVLRRLPRRLLIDLPGEKEREEILKILLRDETLKDDVDIKALAHKTQAFSGSDLKHLCVSAALDSVKEHVEVPWRKSKSQQAAISDTAFETSASTREDIPVEATQAQEDASISDAAEEVAEQSAEKDEEEKPAEPPRTLSWRNFEVALKEITPSSSESLGTLADIRKWNEEFGEGRKERKRQVWGKDRFGFVVDLPKTKGEESKV
ncbi:AAA-domain-containing protein [Cristinia sonorae]|uniref:AAA-domain-containing protein n=1 Tax=Cristinia sonorae TaxID=1940300 RepID=A0A8K0UX04_9AGAR|nr:AAA-domain-containing protein [Cristinia sonorae]